MQATVETTPELMPGAFSLDFDISLREGPYIIRNLATEGDLQKAYHLRHRVFCEELEWRARTDDQVEIDEYDENAVFLGVLDEEEELLSYLRVIPASSEFMLEKEFSSLIGPDHNVRKLGDTVEVSRVCTRPEARNCTVSGNFGRQHISMILYKGLYRWCSLNDVRYLYLVVENKIHRLLRARGFPCEGIGRPETMPDGVMAMATMLDWKKFDRLNSVSRPRMYGWFTRYQSVRIEPRLPRHELYSPHPVYA